MFQGTDPRVAVNANRAVKACESCGHGRATNGIWCRPCELSVFGVGLAS